MADCYWRIELTILENIRRSLAKLKKRSVAILRVTANAIAAPCEHMITRGSSADSAEAGPVFIVGPPRSGTTLVYQVITAAFDCGFVSNRHCYWYRAPVLVEKLKSTPFGAKHEFESELGVSPGPHGPSECGSYWYRFMPRRPHSLEEDSLGEKQINAVRRAVFALQSSVRRPLVFKNLILSLRIRLLVRIFPASIFVVIHRDMADTALSILMARNKQFGNIHRWFSVRPESCQDVSNATDPFIQVATQVTGIYSEIESSKRSLNSDRFIDVSYEDFCSSPESELFRIQGFLSSRGLALVRRTDFECPHSFMANRNKNDVPNEWRLHVDNALRKATAA